MLVAAGLLIAGLAALVVGAELLTRGGSDLAARLGVPPIVVGLTVVAVGTSAPEMAIGIDAAVKGNGALAVGNIAGTNTVNLLLILGLSAAVLPLAIRMETLRSDLPMMVAAALGLLALSLDGLLTRMDGLLLVAGGIFYTVVIVRSALGESRAIRAAYAREFRVETDGGRARWAIVRSHVALFLGIAVTVLASGWFVDGAVALAQLWDVSDAFIGLTIVAIGTSSPELATTLMSTIRNRRDIAIGNLLGSSVYNIAFILGVTCLVPAGGIAVPAELYRIDIPVMALVALVCIPIFLSGRAISRAEGLGLVLAYGAYLGYLVIARA